MTIWNVVRACATKIPWGMVAEHAPTVIDLVKHRDRRNPPPEDELAEILTALTAENERLAKTVAQMAVQVQETQRRAEAIASRQFVLTGLSVLSLIFALSAFVVVAFK